MSVLHQQYEYEPALSNDSFGNKAVDVKSTIVTYHAGMQESSQHVTTANLKKFYRQTTKDESTSSLSLHCVYLYINQKITRSFSAKDLQGSDIIMLNKKKHFSYNCYAFVEAIQQHINSDSFMR